MLPQSSHWPLATSEGADSLKMISKGEHVSSLWWNWDSSKAIKGVYLRREAHDSVFSNKNISKCCLRCTLGLKGYVSKRTNNLLAVPPWPNRWTPDNWVKRTPLFLCCSCYYNFHLFGFTFLNSAGAFAWRLHDSVPLSQ